MGGEPTLAAVARATELAQLGDRDEARAMLAELWDGTGHDPLHRCAVAHAMADVQDDVDEELGWDLRALAAAELITDERGAAAGIAGPLAGMFASLHLNIAECYRKLGRTEDARAQLALGLAATDALGTDGYARFVRSGLDRLADRLENP